IGGLDLKSFPSLFQAKLFCNDLASVDLSSNRWLATADLSDNQLVGIDFSGNPLLEELRISNNDLTELEPSENPRILFLDARYNRFSAEAVDTLLATLVAHGRTGGTVLLDGGGNAAPTARGRGAAWVLTRRFWRVTTNADLDYDADQLPDAWELEVFGDIRENGSGDADGDGLNNLRERLLYLDPTHADSDGDGYLDGVEVAAATDPLDPKDIPPPSGVIEGLVWHDADRNLKRDAIENGIGGISVFLSFGKGSDRVTLRTRTSSEGIYRFADLTGGSYSVAIDWGHWKPLQTTVRKVILNGETEPIGIDFALIDPAVAFSQWASQEFGENIADPRGDPDGDGYPNLLEYALGTHPLVATVKGLPEIASYDDGEGFRLSLRYRMNRDAIDARLVTETYRDGRWQQVEETPGWTGSNRKNSIPVAEGEFGLLRLRASLANDPAITVSSPCWGGHALVLDPGIRSAGLPLVNKRLFAGRVLSNDATSVTLPKLDVPLGKLLGQRRAYLEVVEGLFEGERWEVAGVQPWSDRLALAVQHAANTWKGTLPNLAGQKVVVRSHFTLGQVFGRANEQVLFASASSEEADRVWFLEAGRLAPYHFAATSDGKRTLGWSRWSDLSRFWDERPIFPGEGFFAERQGTHGISLFLLGEVRANRLAMPLSAGSNFVSSGVPFRQSFGGLRLTPLRGLNAGPFPQQADQAFLWTGREFEPYFLFGAFGRGSR
ncbi:MAG: SdrD B-like domain-containing protein, partial [Opitutales bacterium]